MPDEDQASDSPEIVLDEIKTAEDWGVVDGDARWNELVRQARIRKNCLNRMADEALRAEHTGGAQRSRFENQKIFIRRAVMSQTRQILGRLIRRLPESCARSGQARIRVLIECSKPKPSRVCNLSGWVGRQGSSCTPARIGLSLYRAVGSPGRRCHSLVLDRDSRRV